MADPILPPSVIRYRRFRFITLTAALLLFAALSVGVFGYIIRNEYQLQDGFRMEFGEDWIQHYEQRFGPGSVEHAHDKIIVAYVAMPVCSLLLWLIFWQSTRDRSGGRSGGPTRAIKPQDKRW